MRLATFNVLHGRSLSDGRVDADRFAATIRALDVDVLALQEVDRNQARSGNVDLTRVAAAALGARAACFVPAMVGTPSEVWRPATDDDAELGGRPAYGVALVSRFPAVTWRTVRLPAAPFPGWVPLPRSGRLALLTDREARVAVAGVLDTPVGELTVTSTHLTYVPVWNVVQLRRVVAAVADLPDPLILLGDLNMSGARSTRGSGFGSLGRVPTFPADSPRRQLDHALARGSRPAVRRIEAPQVAISDHRPLVVELEWMSG